MAIYQDSKLSPRVWLAGLGICAVAGVGYWMWSAQSDEAGAAEQAAAASAAAAASGGASAWASAGSGGTMPAQVPGGTAIEVTPDSLAILKAAMAKQPNGAAEAERVVSYLNFQHRFEYWQSLEESRNLQQRHQMSQALLAEMPDRLGKGEFTMPESMMMASVLLADLEPDETKREQRLQEWQTKLAAVAPQPAESDEQGMIEKQRQTEFKRAQAVAFSEWQALPDGQQRTQAKLEEMLEVARRNTTSPPQP